MEVSLLAGRLNWHQESGFRTALLNVPSAGTNGFTLLSPTETGVFWTNIISEEMVAKHYNMVSGAGVAAADFDLDGFCDLFFCNRGGESGLFQNLGDGRFRNVTADAGVGCSGQSATGATFADINGDGWPDLLVTTFLGPNPCFLNLGGGRFTNVTQTSGLSPRGGATSLALGDVDGDGDLDLYTAYFGIEAILREGGRLSFQMVNGQPVVTGRHARRVRISDGQLVELGEQDVLYLNDGKGRFGAVNWSQVFRDEEGQPIPVAPMDFGLSVQMRDLNEDGSPDIYVCNDFQTPDRAWLNDGQGRFRAIPRFAIRTMSYASMGVDFADVDRDGRLDFITVEMLSREHARRLRQASSMPMITRRIGTIEDRESVPRNALYWNRGDGTYAEIAWFSGLEASDWSWSPVFLDVDLDGYEDLLVSTGHLHDSMDRDAAAEAARLSRPGMADSRKVLSLYPHLDTRKAAFRNRGNLTFEDVTQAWRFDSRRVCHGIALADLDNDGDLDVVMNSANAPPLLYRNDSPAPRVAVRLKGRAPNTQGTGAKVTLFGGAVASQSQEIVSGGRYLSGDQTVRVFAAGSAMNTMRLEVNWRSGRRSVVNGIEANRFYEIDETEAIETSKVAPDSEPRPLFEDVSALIGHAHHDEEFNDFERQPLLPKKLSQLGPGVAWHDLDGDGWDDLIIGSGKGGRLAVLRNREGKAFERMKEPGWDEIMTRDQTGIVGLGKSILTGLANYEDGIATGFCARVFEAGGKTALDAFAGREATAGPLALGDLDGDGILELFVGGRVIPGRYPEAAASMLFKQRDGHWEADREHTDRFARLGLVSGAVWSDLNGDGFPELILVCEWGPVRVFRNEAGKLLESTITLRGARATTLSALSGWWNGVTTGDFDGDGRMDIVASNWGLNGSYRASPERPRRMYYGDLAGRGMVDLVEAYDHEQTRTEVPERDLNAVAAALPFLRGKFSTYAGYAQASLKDIYGDKLQSVKKVEVTTLETMVFLNRGDHFEAATLPAEAQFSPAFATCVGDVDGDGDEDIFLSQNFFATRPEISRLDSGRGLWLEGDGHGRFRPMPGQRSGVRAYGEQRGAALSDYDRDGRIDLVVAQNGAATKLYHNVHAKPGLLVHLSGPPGNPVGVGAQIRLQFGGAKGPAREIHAGSGYWSQDSSVQVFGGPTEASSWWVRWPGGKVTTGSLKRGAREIQLNQSGGIQVLR